MSIPECPNVVQIIMNVLQFIVYLAEFCNMVLCRETVSYCRGMVPCCRATVLHGHATVKNWCPKHHLPGPWNPQSYGGVSSSHCLEKMCQDGVRLFVLHRVDPGTRLRGLSVDAIINKNITLESTVPYNQFLFSSVSTTVNTLFPSWRSGGCPEGIDKRTHRALRRS
jgi:hypothetical protein